MRVSILLALVLAATACRADTPSPEAPARPLAAEPLAQFARPDTIPAPVTAAHAMVVSGHPEASRIGVEVMRDGGNAVDAAVAVGFALAVVVPDAGNVGGGGFLLARFPDGRATSFDFREVAPAAATRDMYVDARGRPVPGRSTRGHLASGVPGTVAGLLLAHERYGSLPLARLLAPAIKLARDGQWLTPRNALLFNRYKSEFEAYPASAHYFIREDGEPFGPGQKFRQPDLADVLERIAAKGRDGFYRGETADLIVRGDGARRRADLPRRPRGLPRHRAAHPGRAIPRAAA